MRALDYTTLLDVGRGKIGRFDASALSPSGFATNERASEFRREIKFWSLVIGGKNGWSRLGMTVYFLIKFEEMGVEIKS